MTPKERDIEKFKNKIEESENKLKRTNQNGPLVVAFVGIVLFFFSLFLGLSAGFFGIGLILVLSAGVWAIFKSKEAAHLKEAIFLYKMELYRLERKT
jgi:hypothetical protein